MANRKKFWPNDHENRQKKQAKQQTQKLYGQPTSKHGQQTEIWPEKGQSGRPVWPFAKKLYHSWISMMT